MKNPPTSPENAAGLMGFEAMPMKDSSTSGRNQAFEFFLHRGHSSKHPLIAYTDSFIQPLPPIPLANPPDKAMYRKLPALAAIASMLYGCATPIPPYTPPPGVPYANIKSAINGAHGRYESIDIYLFDTNGTPPGRRKLFSINKSVSKPAGYVQVPANTPLNLTYYETASGGRYCQLFIKVNLEQDKNYSLIGGFAYEKGPIPILTDTRKCELGVIDDSTNMPAP
jgi:hypothetical protein